MDNKYIDYNTSINTNQRTEIISIISSLEQCLAKLGRYKNLKDMIDVIEPTLQKNNTNNEHKVLILEYCDKQLDKKIIKCLGSVALIISNIDSLDLNKKESLDPDIEKIQEILSNHFNTLEYFLKDIDINKLKELSEKYVNESDIPST